MADRWLAAVGADARGRARQIARAHAAFLSTGALDPAAAPVREVVADSWLRSSAARVDPDRDPPVTLLDGDLAGYRAGHPLAAVVPVLRDLVGGTADDGEHVWAVMDAGGRLLWVEGHRGARARAARMNFVEGALWDEAHAGTNAPGTALALDHEVQIFAAEHFRHTVQAWTCAAAPIHDPATGRILGVLDVTGGDAVAHPHSLALVRAAARVAEAHLATLRAGPAARPPAARLRVLGRPDGVLLLDRREIPLHRRHAEAVAILAAHPEGMTGQQLAAAMYDDGAAQATLRVELLRLRRLVGPLLHSRPYRLAEPVGADFLDVTRALEMGDVAAAVRAYAGPLLPTSDAPAIAERRRRLEVELRSAVLTATDPSTVYAWASGAGFDDLAAWERLARTAGPGTPHLRVAATRVAELRAEYGLNTDATLM
ncbi:GAF domain-containing protein [Phytohabitans suffuscus]|uniref:Transcriptional regulator n=1 Tax=Phytohabitans suffuscus TaxID=624315 RepID=A0A6F8YX65_9ACTN|nr:GAF domain-containing protein [Phytohabitans suffuscus]BCB90679.1 transcriptional regulator [Phytohabitans suffuscus]